MDRNRSKQIKPTAASKAAAATRAAAAVATTLLLLAVTLSSCTKEPTGGELPSPDGESIAVHITFPKSEQPQAANAVVKSNAFAAKASASGDALSNASGDAEGLTFWTSDTPNSTTRATDPGTEAERQIDKMTILVFNEDGTKLENVQTIDLTSANTSLPTLQPLWESEKTLIVRPIIDKSSPKKIYAIANWNKYFNDKLYTEAMLKDEKTQMGSGANEFIRPPLLMVGSSSVNLSTSDSKVTIELERQVAKFNINTTIDKATRASLPNIEWLTDKAKIVAIVPRQSYVVGRQLGEFVSKNQSILYDYMPNASTPDDVKWNYSLYLYENPQLGSDKPQTLTRLQIQLPYRDKVSDVEEYDNYYNIEVKNTGDAENPYVVARNTIYNFNLKVMGLGSMFSDIYQDANVDFDLTVNPWEEQDIEVGNKPKYFNISRSFVGFQFNETGQQKVTISTDVSDWRLTKADGTTLFSFAENKTAPFTDGVLTYTISGTASSATITVTKNSTETFAQQVVTLVARNIRVPFTVAYDNGIIPNSVLEAAGWTASAADRPTGLQVAKLGNVLPFGMALAVDQFVAWSTELVDTKVIATGYGFGKSNTAELLKLDAAKYPAVNICKTLGEGWYLPSIEELKSIYANKSLLGVSYEFRANIYWSATQNTANNAYAVFFTQGITHIIDKTVNYYLVRCVRDI